MNTTCKITVITVRNSILNCSFNEELRNSGYWVCVWSSYGTDKILVKSRNINNEQNEIQ